MPKKGSSGEHNWSFAFSPSKSRPRPKLFQEDRRTLQNILVDSVKDYKYKKNEMFKRIKPTTFVQLILHIAEIQPRQELPTLNEMETPFRPDTADLEVQKIQSDSGGMSARGGAPAVKFTSPDDRLTREELLQKIGRADNGTCGGPRAAIDSSTCPYLLLDIRDRATYEECHIISAKCYPSPTLARAYNYESKDMLKFRNQEGKIVILYDNDESEQTVRAMATLVERGYENLFLLTGGLREAYKIFPRGLITGTMPVSLLNHVEMPKINKFKVSASAAVTPQPRTAREAAQPGEFTQDDLDCLHMYLDNALRDNSSGSRLTQNPRGPAGRTSTRLSTLSSSTDTTGIGRRPFRP